MSRRTDAEREAADLRLRWENLRDDLAEEADLAERDVYDHDEDPERAEARGRAEALREALSLMEDTPAPAGDEEARDAVNAALEQLEPAVRSRVLRWAADKYGTEEQR